MNWEQKIAVALRQPGAAQPDKFCRVIVELSGKCSDQIKSIIKANQGTVYREIKIVPALVVDIPCSALPELAQSVEVKKITLDPQVKHCVRGDPEGFERKI